MLNTQRCVCLSVVCVMRVCVFAMGGEGVLEKKR